MQNEYLSSKEGLTVPVPAPSVTEERRGFKKETVSVINSEKVVGELLREYLARSERLQLCLWGQHESGYLHKLATESTDIVLIAAAGSQNSALRSVHFLKHLRPELTIVMIVDQLTLGGFIRYLQVGVDGIFRTPGTHDSFEDTVIAASNGWKPFPREIGKALAEHIACRFLTPNGYLLTRAESEVLAALLEGRRDKEIARIRSIGAGTVHSITNTIYKKFNVNSRAELIKQFLPLDDPSATVTRIQTEAPLSSRMM